MKYTQLISTSNEDKIDDHELIFLGNWCKNFDYLINDNKVVNYHWDNRSKLKDDYNYINDLYEKLIPKISKTLNKLHSKSYSDDYWRIILGYWLFYYLSVNIDRWENINCALNQFKEINSYQGLNSDSLPIPANTREFINLASDGRWNHLTYTKILKFLINKKKLNILIVEKKYINLEFYYNYQINLKHKIKNFIINLYLKIFKNIIKKNKIVLFKTYLGLINELKMNLRYRQFPIFCENKRFEKNIDNDLRNELDLDFNPKNLFESFILEDIFKNMPSEFLENYKKIDEYLENYYLPENPKLIFSSRSLATDNIFVRYIAKKKEIGCKLIYGQHGGGYGQIDFTWAEDHEIKISDKYLTWGWYKKNNDKVKSFYLIKDINHFKFQKTNNIKNLCYFLRSRPKYTGRIDGSTGSNQMSKYYKDCLNFAKDLNENDNFNITPRFHEARFEWNHIGIWKKYNFKKFSFTNTESLKYVYKNYDLLIYSYIGTGFLESIALNKPFILVSSLLEWPLRKEAVEDFYELEKVNIFFKDNDKAKLHLKFIHNNLHGWWNSDEVIRVKNFFKQKYARIDVDNKRREELYNLIEKLNKNVI
tara:strand:+ start:1031 stop:2806 length:1776 start_codon:yes stop_codon:yes gene_type:complete